MRTGVLRSGLGVGLALLLFWILLGMRIPYSISGPLSSYSTLLFLAVFACYAAIFGRKGPWATMAGLGLTMLLFAFTISFQSTSGYTDTGMIGGLVPYKDAKNYYHGALQILNGLPLRFGIQAVRRPLFPGLLAALLSLSDGNLRLALALLAQVGGVSLYVAARAFGKSFGPLPAGLFTALLYFYIQPKIGYSVSELPGFMLGCWAFCILWAAAVRRTWLGLMLGLATLMVAVSIRAGAFLIFPALAVWMGWILRRGRGFSVRTAVAASGLTALLYLLVNQGFSRLLDIDLTNQWGSFAYAVYGQVQGGTGWHSAIDDLQTTEGSVVLAAALQDFLANPLLLAVATVKSYGDFFLPGNFMIFPFGSVHEPGWLLWPLWAATVTLLVLGLVGLWRNRQLAHASMIGACFVGTLLSIPLLPPVDSGARFHASTIPFLFAIPAAALAGSKAWERSNPNQSPSAPDDGSLAMASATMVLIFTLIVPIIVYKSGAVQKPERPVCAAELRPFGIQTSPGSYVDLVPTPRADCGRPPHICLADFEQHATDKRTDDLVQALIAEVSASAEGVRITPAMDLLSGQFAYYLTPLASKPGLPRGQLALGCASLIPTRNSRLLRVESLGPE
ncbi:MAG TPA: hypothetical protein VLL49_05015 [Anaerolineales bacterium]|nr:hypothetical protein [Anaerolineales bacterium]